MKEKLAFLFLIIIGLMQLTGDLTGLPAIKAIGAATGASPAPKVFTAHQGFETYSSRFYIDWQDSAGNEKSLQLTPQVYRGITGPYNRRNAYGATFSYAPVLTMSAYTKPMFESAAHYALCGDAPILHELGILIEGEVSAIRVRLAPRQTLPKGHPWKLNYEINCDA